MAAAGAGSGRAGAPLGFPIRMVATMLTTKMAAPTDPTTAKTPLSPIIRWAASGNWYPSTASVKFMSQWRRGTPRVPAPIMKTDTRPMPMPKR